MKKQRICAYIREHARIYIVLAVVMLVGVVKGWIDFTNLTEVTVIRLEEYIKKFFVDGIIVDDVFYKEVVSLAKIFLVVWISGACLVGIPVIVYIIYFKGYMLGFSSAVLIKTMGVKGIGMLTIVVLSKDIFLIPITIGLGVTAIKFSLYIMNSKRMVHTKKLFMEFMRYGLSGVGYGVLAVAAVVINIELIKNGHCKNIIDFFSK